MNMFTQETLYPSFFEKKSLSTLQTFCKTFTFYAFLLFLTVSEVCNISKKYRLPNKSGKKYFTQDILHASIISKKLELSIAEVFRNNYFFTKFLLVFTWMRCTIFQTNTDLRVI